MFSFPTTRHWGVRPTPSLTPNQLVNIRLFGIEAYTLDSSAKALIEVCSQGDGGRNEFLISRYRAIDLKAAIQTMLTQLPGALHAYESYAVQISRDELYLLKLTVIDSITLWMRKRKKYPMPLTDSDRGWLRIMKDLHRALYQYHNP